MLQCALDSFESPKIKEFVTKAIKITNGLTLLTNDLLDFGQFMNKKFNLNWDWVSLDEVLSDIESLFTFQAKKKAIKFIIDNKYGNRKLIYTDEQRLKQVLYNLIGNALKFTTKGFIKISVSFQIIEQMECIQFEVADSGQGIKQEDIPKLFHLYGKIKQSDPNVNKNGVGLGLYNCKFILISLNPEMKEKVIQVESKENQGTIFKFYLKKEKQSPENHEDDNEVSFRG